MKQHTANILSETAERKQKPETKTSPKIQNQKSAPRHPRQRCLDARTEIITAMARCLHQSPTILLKEAPNSNIAETREKVLKRNYMKMAEVLKKEINKSLNEIQGNTNTQLQKMNKPT